MDSPDSAPGAGKTDNMASSHANPMPEKQHKNPSSSDSMTLSGNNEQESSSGSISPQSTDHADAPLDNEDGKREEAITALAKAMSNSSATQSNPFEAAPDSVLDPHSPNFRAKDWVKSMIKFSRGNGDDALGRKGGVSFSALSAYGANVGIDFQKDVSNVWWDVLSLAKRAVGLGKQSKLTILHGLEGVVESGEMLVVLGPPGSGCSTFLKTITGQTHGLEVEAELNYNGLSSAEINSCYRGEAIYTAEVDVHFPQLSVGDTLSFAAATRAPRIIPGGYKRAQWANHLRDVAMATFGISHTINTIVGNDFVRGVSGGERKRVTIAEAALSGAPIQAWDNSTRGLDAANAIEFCKTIRLTAKYCGAAALMSLYQAPQQAYEQFDKVLVLYQGRQIFFGPIMDAQAYFERLGFQCPERQTTADFLTSMTSPKERLTRPGFEQKAPRTPDDFADAWRRSHERELLLTQMQAYNDAFQLSGEARQAFIASRRAQQSKGLRKKSPYTLNYLEQIQICLWRGLKRLKGDPAFTYTQLFGNFALALILGSVFYNTPNNAESFFQRGATLFFAILMNAFGSALEILTLYQQRPIVEKQSRYAMYHPSAEALASMLTDMPYKITNAIVFNATLYFLANLRREPGNFFIFLFVNFTLTLTMSMLFRTVGSLTRSLSQALAPAANIMLGLIIFTGFALPEPYMLGWSRWIKYIDPIAFGFESLMINEFAGRRFPCTEFVPPYGSDSDNSRVCTAVSAVPGQPYVDGTAYVDSAYRYQPSHKWRNVGILYVMMFGLMAVHLIAIEKISEKKSKGEVLVFQKGKAPRTMKASACDEESGAPSEKALAEKEQGGRTTADIIQRQDSIFSWKDVCYDIKIKKDETRRILDNVDGWVRPGALTALMGVSGAGKTTLLDVLAERVTVGVITGEMLVDGRPRDSSFQRKTGYVQQQDIHLGTSSVREALRFSALMRQPAGPREEKLAYVEEIIRLLDMEEYADATVGVPGEGLNVEQRKRLTIGVELAAKPQLLLFFDEPTSGLDSQTSWAICDLMEKLKNSGQAILCTIHQPSAMLFQRFDRLLFLAKGGRTVYFGDIGENSRTLIEYFEKNGASPCGVDANPAEWMLEVIGAAPGSHTDTDWFEVWRSSPEYQQARAEIDGLISKRLDHAKDANAQQPDDADFRKAFAAPFAQQMREVTYRIFEQYWRTPSYLYSKLALCLISSLFVGFVFFDAATTQRGLQNQMFSIFVHLTIFQQLSQQIMPHFVTQRSLYEARERQSKTYSWQAFILSNIFVEICWNSLMAAVIFFCYYYPVGLYQNAQHTDQVHLRGALYFLFLLQFMLWGSTFTTMIIAGMPTAEEGANIANLLFSLALVFCGVLASPESLPGFWIFMYRVSPFTYLIGGLLSTGLANTPVTCAENEFVNFSPPSGVTCGDYMQPYFDQAPGYLQNREDTQSCGFCSFGDSNVFLSAVGISYDDVWRNFGLLWVYIFVNIAGAVFFFWLARVPKRKK